MATSSKANEVEVRPLRPEDVAGAYSVMVAAFRDLEARAGLPDHPHPPIEVGRRRFDHLAVTDPGGAWVAVDRNGAVLGSALALLRDGLWGLSLLVVRPEAQSAGIGRRLLEQAWAYGAGAGGRSSSPRPTIGPYGLTPAWGSPAGDREVTVEWITAAQSWAVAPCLDAGLALCSNAEAVFLGGDVGPFHPYLPNGAYL